MGLTLSRPQVYFHAVSRFSLLQLLLELEETLTAFPPSPKAGVTGVSVTQAHVFISDSNLADPGLKRIMYKYPTGLQ